ncbi:ciliary microtubule inner protein 5 isoform X2 [Phalacrocorax aristotelis]|uniref:ciliary microtubule inner protein 5 isoform X2 n=1 Tax=Phalacrocorax aristotelis TaxID=126867 RepID=UPI003F4BFD0C
MDCAFPVHSVTFFSGSYGASVSLAVSVCCQKAGTENGMSTQSRRPVIAQPAARAWADKQAALQQDQVQQDKIWRESAGAEQRGRKIWYQNWSFLKDYEQMGKKKEQKPLPNYLSGFSSKVPNSTNQTIGSRINTELGRALVNMDYFFSSGARKRKLEGELQFS